MAKSLNSKMHETLKSIPEKILYLGLSSLKQAITSSTLYNPRGSNEDVIAILNAAHAGELIFKALIAKEHPLLIFRNLHEINKSDEYALDIYQLLEKGITHDFSKLPNVLFACSGIKVPDIESFNTIRKVRNQIQHFIEPDLFNYSEISLNFIFKNLDPLLREHFDLYAIEYHTDEFYDHIVSALIAHQLTFSIPNDFELSEIDLNYELADRSTEHRLQIYDLLSSKGKCHLLSTTPQHPSLGEDSRVL